MEKNKDMNSRKTLQPARLTYGKIRSSSEKFLEEFHPSLKPPIPIEDIVELAMGIRLSTTQYLKEYLDVDGFIHTNFEEITVDDNTFNKYPQRTRFTIAHEIGHKILHEKIYKQYEIQNKEDYQRFQNSISEEDHKWLETQANSFAGCVLVPTKPLKEAVSEVFKSRGIKGPFSIDHSVPIFEDLPDIFNVSPGVIYIRLEKEKLVKKTWRPAY